VADEPTGLDILTAPEEPEAPDGGDDCLLEGLVEGAEWAYESLIERYNQPVYSLVCRPLWDPAEACAAVQAVFLKEFRKIGSFRGESSLKTWIYRIAVNEAYNYQRWYSRHRRQEVCLEGSEDDGPSYYQRLRDPGRSPLECAEAEERHGLIQEALARLNGSFRAAVVLRDIEELSYEEIAEVLRIPLGTVKSRILRGREALRKELAGRLEPSPALGWTPQPAE